MFTEWNRIFVRPEYGYVDGVNYMNRVCEVSGRAFRERKIESQRK